MWIAKTPSYSVSESEMYPSPSSSLTTTAFPVQRPFLDKLPLMMSQYVPFGRQVCIVCPMLPPLVKATKPALPRQKAICWSPFDHQLLMLVPSTAFLNPTMLYISRQRCSQTHPLSQTPSLLGTGPIIRPLLSWGGPNNNRIMEQV